MCGGPWSKCPELLYYVRTYVNMCVDNQPSSFYVLPQQQQLQLKLELQSVGYYIAMAGFIPELDIVTNFRFFFSCISLSLPFNCSRSKNSETDQRKLSYHTKTILIYRRRGILMLYYYIYQHSKQLQNRPTDSQTDADSRTTRRMYSQLQLLDC